MDLSILGIVIALVLLVILVYRRVSTGIATVICGCVVAVFAGIPILTALKEYYVEGFASAAQSYLFLFGLGGLFAGIMEETGAAAAFARLVSGLFGKKYSLYACMLATMLLCYGGVNAFVVCFTVYPIFLSLFQENNLPRRLIPGAMFAGSAGFVSCSLPGVPSTINLAPTEVLGTSPMSALPICIVTSLFAMVFIYFYFEYEVKKAAKKGEGFIPTAKDLERIEKNANRDEVNKWISVIPMLTIFITLNFFKWDVIYSLFSGCVVGVLLFWNKLDDKIAVFNRGYDGVSIVLNVGAAVAFGYVVKNTSGFEQIINWVTNMGGSPLISLGLATNVVSGALSSGSGGVALASQIFGPKYIAMGINPELVHRIIAIGSQGFDTLPHNGGVVTYLEVAGCTHKESYKPIFITSLVLPLLLLVIAIIMGSIIY